MRIWVWFFTLLVLSASASAEQMIEEGDLKFSVDIAPLDVKIGERVKVRFMIEYKEGTKCYFPENPLTKPFILVGHEKDIPTVTGINTVENHTLILMPVRLGTLTLAPIEVPYIAPSGETKVAMTPEVRIQVGGRLANDAKPELSPSGEPIHVYVPNTLLIWTLFGIGVAIVACVLGILGYRAWVRWKEAHRPPPPPRPPIEIARERISAIEAMGLLEARDYKQLALLLSEVVREYLGGIFGFAGIEFTTYEVVREIADKRLGKVTPQEIEDFLSFCDLIKFAKFSPTENEAGALSRRAREIVEGVEASRIVQEAGKMEAKGEI